MPRTDLKGVYFVKNTQNGNFIDITTLVDGARILKVEGFNEQGQAKNVYTTSWVYDENEDFVIVMPNDTTPVKIVRECTDISITFIIKQKYATSTIDVQTQHQALVEYFTSTDVWIKSGYANNKIAHCVCLKEYKPTTEKYQRGESSYALGTITLHNIEKIND